MASATNLEKQFFELGMKKVKSLKPVDKHRVRMYLIEANRTYGVQVEYIPPTWKYFKDRYNGTIYHKSMMNLFTKSKNRYK